MTDILETAKTYLDNTDALIYSYHGNTFLQGGGLADPANGGRGRIDCSTLVHLALAGISYSESPYVTGDPGDLVFFTAPASVYEEYVRYGAYMAVSHVGIVTENTDLMINATGRSDHDYNAGHTPVMITPVSSRGLPVITARMPGI